MKNKVLLSTLLGGALLAGCTADDALDVKRNVAEGVNPAAPVFTVSFGDELTRATMATDGVHAMTWQSIDKMSLFHGGGSISDIHVKNDNSDFLASGKVMNLNAIYGMSGGEGQTPVFTTASMVTEGLAIMVYPADTTFAQVGKNPVISLEMDQKAETKNLTPHISEVLDITTHGSLDDEETDNSHSAGYGRKYDLVMRQIGGQLRLTLNGENAGVEGIEFRKVTMTVEKANYSPFTKDLEVKVGQPRRFVNENGNVEGSEEVGKNTEDHKYWKYSPWLEPTENGRSQYISTTDVENGKTAIFTLLPYEDRPESQFKAPFENGYDGDAQYGNVTIKVETNFGWVEVKDEGDSKLWSNKSGVKQSINDGLAAILQALFKSNAKGDELYSGQLIGKGGERFLSVDLSNLQMKGLHVKDEGDLEKVLAVYDVLKKGKSDDEVTFILDGNDDGKFIMTEGTWQALEERLAEEGNKVSFALCNDEAPCKAVVLDNSDNEAAAEVPALKFVTEAGEEKVQEEIVVELVGEWKYTDVTGNKNTETNVKVKALDIDKLVVTDDAKITLKNFIAAIGTFEIVVENKAVVTVSGVVTLQENMTNFGTINISAKTDQLAVDKDVTLWNREIQFEKNEKLVSGWWNDKVNDAGRINVVGTLAIVSNSTGKIHNRGVINMNDDNSIVLISSNADKDANIIADYKPAAVNKNDDSSANRFGTINLNKNAAGEKTLTIKEAATQKGFIKYGMTQGTKCNQANYCVVDKNDFPESKATYVEITYDASTINAKALANIDALILPLGTSIYIPTGVAVTMSTKSTLYVEGTITHAAAFDYGTGNKGLRKGYFGDSTGKGGIYSMGL